MMNSMLRRIPYLTVTLLIWLTICFWLQWTTDSFIIPGRISVWFSVSKDMVMKGHFLRLVTANFFHVNPGHWLSNMIGLLFYTAVLERMIGHSRTLFVVFLSAIGGTLGSIAIEWVSWMVGASTILYGVFGALGAVLCKYRKNLGRWFPALAILWLFQLILLIMAGTMALKVVDQGAHIGGFVAGVSAALIITHGCSWGKLHQPVSLRMNLANIGFGLLFALAFIKEVLPLWR